MIALHVEDEYRKTTSQLASERREHLVSLLCARDYEARRGEKLAAGEEPDPMPGPGWGQCARCLRYFSFDRLQVDHVDGCGWSHRALSAWKRVTRYFQEFRRGVRMRALCDSCNRGHLNNRWRS